MNKNKQRCKKYARSPPFRRRLLLPADWDVPCFLPPDDGGLRIAGDFAREFHHLALELGRVLRTFEDARFGADDETRGRALPRPNHVVRQTLESASVLRANVRNHQVALVFYLNK